MAEISLFPQLMAIFLSRAICHLIPSHHKGLVTVYDGLRLRTWSDMRDISAFYQTQPIQAQTPKAPETLVQATSWHRNAQGKIEMVAANSSSQISPTLTCAAAPQN